MILHVLLTILKVIGIILLVILGIFLVLLLLLLFVPLRYRLHVKKAEDVLAADGRMTWLLHLLRADLTYENRQGTAVVRVLGFRVKTVHFPGGKKAEQEDTSGSGNQVKEDKKEVPSGSGNQIKEDKAEVPFGSGDQAVEEDHRASEGGNRKASEKEKDSSVKSWKNKVVSIFRRPTGKSKDREKKEEFRKTKKGSGESLPGRLVNLFSRLISLVLELILQIPGLPAEVYDKIDSVQELLHLKLKKIDPFLSIEAEHMFGKMIRYLRFLIRGYAPRKITGYLHFGTGAPDITGKLAGLVFVLLPESGTEYDVDPDFYETVFETDTNVKGHIRMYRLAWVAVRLVLDKEFWRLLRRIRGKETTGGKHLFPRKKRRAVKEDTEIAA